MLRSLRFIEKTSRDYAKLSSVFVAALILWIDFITGTEVQFPLAYVIPVGLAAWRKQRILAYALAVTLPVLRIAYEFPWETSSSLAIPGINALIEIAAMALYAFLVGRTAAQTRQLKQTITTREQEISQLRTFAKKTSATLQGRGLSPGMVAGVVRIHMPPENEWTSAPRSIARDDVEAEIGRLDRALAAAVDELDDTQKTFAADMAAEENALLDAHAAMLNDVGFWDQCRRRVREDLIQVEQAVAEEVQKMVANMEGMKQEVMRERSADIRDIGSRVLRNVRSPGETTPDRLVSLPPDTILVATELLPSDIMQLDHAHLAALVTERNGPASHVAILARARNIPAVSDIKDATSLLVTGDRLLVDAGQGTVTLAPTTAQTELFTARRSRSARHEPAKTEDSGRESVTKDGVRIGLYANISRTDEAHLVLEYRLEGVGLFRSEFLFLDVAEPPHLDAQAAAYSAMAQTLNPRPVVIRTMDFGGDKIPRFNRTENEIAFRMGKRGLAFSLTEKAMFRDQLRAIVRAAQAGDVRIMFPMVMSVAEMEEARCLVDESVESEHLAKRPSIGAMIETPAAVFDIHGIVRIADFVSIGTNDLSHFILATDRQSQGTDGVLSFLHPCILRATEQVVRAALGQGVGLTVCGEAAGHPVAACLLVGMGVRGLSINPFQAVSIRHVLRQLTLEQAERVVRDALSATTPEDVQQIVASALCWTDV